MKSESVDVLMIYDKRDVFDFLIVNFPFISSNFPAATAYGVYISQLIRYSRPSASYQDLLIEESSWLESYYANRTNKVPLERLMHYQ